AMVIYSDYDVDGITSASILRLFLDSMGAGAIRHFMPDRKKEGYGLTAPALERCLQTGLKPNLLIVLDCGTNSRAEVASAKAGGIDVLIVDHHQVGEVAKSDALVNPQLGSSHHHLCTAGLVFKLCHAYLKAEGGRQFDLRTVLDLVALATVADLVPLEKDNRIFVREGLRRLVQTVHPGLRRLMEVSGGGVRTPTTFTLGFQLGPRINAGGRVGEASAGLNLLLSRDPGETAKLARELDLQNRKRQELEAMVLEEAEAEIGESPDGLGLVAASDRWHPGVVGIVAARLVRKYHRPSFVIALEEGAGKGSGRGLPGVSLMDALRACAPCLKGFGGHEGAAGITIEADRVAEFRKILVAWLEKSVRPEVFEKSLSIEMSLLPEHLTPEMARAVGDLAPFGKGNPEPVFQLDGVTMVSAPKVFAERHLKFRAQAGERKFEVVGFDFARRPPDRPTFDLAGSWEWDEYTDAPRWRMVDWR
ncbi:MAG: single-stranded-DNA-specific exonuclease RecJ, partial [Verrucomicrobia bacterium]|nr:single-stranded-DNA-specific exonuclease RecJ [Verrucomicrobiota bacterium]